MSKFLCFVAGLLMAGLALPTPAHAYYENVFDLSLGTGSIVSGSIAGDYLLGFHDALAAQTTGTLTLTLTLNDSAGFGSASAYGLSSIGASDAKTEAQKLMGDLDALSPSFTSFTSASPLTYVWTLVFSNTTGSSANFAAAIKAQIGLEGCGSLTYTYATSAIPLPPAFLMFVSALVLITAFAARKRAHG